MFFALLKNLEDGVEIATNPQDRYWKSGHSIPQYIPEDPPLSTILDSTTILKSELFSIKRVTRPMTRPMIRMNKCYYDA